MTSIPELQTELQEWEKFLEAATVQRVKDKIDVEIHRVKSLIIQKKAAEVKPAEHQSPAGDAAKPARFVKELSTYAWDQSDKFMKIYVTDLKGAHNLPKENISCTFTARTLRLRVTDLNGIDYSLGITHLKEEIIPDDSYAKSKTDMVLVMLKKKAPNKTWPYVTEKESILKEKREREKKAKQDSYKDDPQAGLMGMLKDMYDDGDDEMKRTIAKAMAESQDKRNKGEDPYDDSASGKKDRKLGLDDDDDLI